MSKFEGRTLTQQELEDEARARFGDDPWKWAFECPRCGDVATAGDFPEGERDRLGRECVGRALGILKKNQVYKGRGCDWAAFGLFRGPWEIIMPSGRSSWAFPLAEATKEKA